jgi:23S rRNA pseudouridine2605 synthase
LARAISKMGYCSRSRATELIHAGEVRINGVVRRDAETSVHLGRDRLDVAGHPIGHAEKIYLMLNKPRGVVTTASDERGRDTVYKYLGDYSEEGQTWLAPVGRLDKASEGLLLITNDSEWGAKIAAPDRHVSKTYHVQVAAMVGRDSKLLEKLIRGFVVADGECLRATSARLLRRGQRNCWIEMVLEEGRNRQIRRMFEVLDIEVLRLIRVRIGALQLGNLPKGAVRILAPEDRELLFTKTAAV